ncbi:MAG: FMN-binding negative transcriptional regulator [Rhizobiaceae bacterium]
MYEPVHFEETDPSTLHALIRAHPLGLLISADADDLQANPIPFLLDSDAGEKGVLRAHVARANPQWKHLQSGAKALVVFQGTDAYVTPSWYQSKRDHGKVVPTWNYSIVQVRGSIRIIDDANWLHSQIVALTHQHEKDRTAAWQVTDAPPDFVEMQKRAIIGLEMTISDIRSKWKVSQNRPVADRVGVAAGFAQDGVNEMAELVRQYGKV